jgi:hypothetical protein
VARLRTYFAGTVSPEPTWNFRGIYTDQKLNTDPGDDVGHEISFEDGIIRWNKRPPLGKSKTAYSGDKKGRGYYNASTAAAYSRFGPCKRQAFPQSGGALQRAASSRQLESKTIAAVIQLDRSYAQISTSKFKRKSPTV